MRRRRQVLQVSTFPFLAVLLCTMGSLILLLLIIDRRARIVALAKAQKKADAVAARLTAEEEHAAEVRKAEFERRRQALHDLLAQQDGELRHETGKIRDQLDETATKLGGEQSLMDQLLGQYRTEKNRLTQAEKDLVEGHDALFRASEQTKAAQAAARADMARMTADLQQLEVTLAALKFARQRDQHTFSLVPYRGKRGDHRRPLYIECADRRLIFHPDHLVFDGLNLSGKAIRTEIERRIGPAKSQSPPYLLMLVRPDGISTYYEAMTALRSLDFDFGYECVDADWVLDFPEKDDALAAQPWMLTGKPNDSQNTAPLPPPRPRGQVAVAQGDVERGARSAERQDQSRLAPGASRSGDSSGSGGHGQGRSSSGTGIGTDPGGPNGSGGIVLGTGQPGVSNGMPGTSGQSNPGTGAPIAGGSEMPGPDVGIPGATNTAPPGTAGLYPGGSAVPGASPGGRTQPGVVASSGGTSGAGGTGPGGPQGPGGIALGAGQPGASTGMPGQGGLKLPGTPGQPNPGSAAPIAGGYGPPGPGTGMPGAAGTPPGTAGLSPGGSGVPGASGGLAQQSPNTFIQGLQGQGRPGQQGASVTGSPPGAVSGAGVPQQGTVIATSPGSAIAGSSQEGTAGGGGTGAGMDGSQAPSSGTGSSAGSGGGSGSASAGSMGSGQAGSDSGPAGGSQGAAAPDRGSAPGSTGRQASSSFGSDSGSSMGQSSASSSGPALSPNDGSTSTDPEPDTGKRSRPLPPPLQSPIPTIDTKPSPPAPPRPVRIYSNRDWIILIECTPDALILHPSRMRFDITTLQSESGSNNRLAQAVQQMITRRQASVRPGEPPYRPQIRFQVPAEALRTYYLAYPMLASLQLPMTRQNVDPDPPVRP